MEQVTDLVWRVGEVLLDTYEITGVLGEGGMGRVYRARHLSWNVDLAIKCPRLEVLDVVGGTEAFKREAETWVGLGLHPHVVTAFYVRTIGELPRVFAEYVDGESLRQAIRTRSLYRGGTRAALARMLDIAIQLAWGLHHAHARGVVHQDVKPANVMLSRNGTAKVTDFGLAKARAAGLRQRPSQLPSGPPSTPTIVVSVGAMTPAYASPEQWHGQQVSRKTDVWSFGVSLLEMFMGDVTWLSGIVAPEVLDSYLEAPFDEEIPRMPEAFVELVRRCLAEAPSDRPADLREAALSLGQLYEHLMEEPYARGEPPEQALLADSLNNRAVSLADLGREGEAEQAFVQAHIADPHHPYIAYNHALVRWRNGHMTDEEAILRVIAASTSSERAWEIAHLQTWIHAERGDAAGATAALNDARARAGDDAYSRTSIAAASKAVGSLLDPALPRFALHHIPMLDGAGHVAVSADGQTLLAGRMDRVEVWDLGQRECTGVLRAHAKHIALSPDGRFAALGSGNSVGLWDVQSRQAVSRWDYRFDFTPVFLPDYFRWGRSNDESAGFALRSVLEEYARLLANSRTGYHARDLDTIPMGFPTLVRSEVVEIAMSGSGTVLVTRQRGGSVAVFDGDGNLAYELWIDGATTAIAVSHDGHRTAVVRDGVIHIYDTSKAGEARARSQPRPLMSLRATYGTTATVRALYLSHDGSVAVSLGTDKRLRVWIVAQGRCICTVPLASDGTLLTVAPDAESAIVGQQGGQFFMFRWGAALRVHAPLLVSPVRASGDVIREQQQLAAMFNDARRLIDAGEPPRAVGLLRQIRATPGYERRPEVLALWALAQRRSSRGRLLGVYAGSEDIPRGNDRAVKALALAPDGSRLAVSRGTEACVHVIDMRGKEEPFTLIMPLACVPKRVAFSGDGRTMAAVGDDGPRVWPGYDRRDLAQDIGDRHGAFDCALTHDGRLIAYLTDRNDILVHDTRLRLFRKSNAHVPTAITISDDGRLVVIGTIHGDLQVLDVERDVWLKPCSVGSSPIGDIVLDPSGRIALTTNNEGTVVASQLLRSTARPFNETHTGKVDAIAVDRSGTVALTGGDDGSVRLWDVATGQCLAVMATHPVPVRAVALSGDASMAITGSEDGAIRSYHIDWDIHSPPEPAESSLADVHINAFLARHSPWWNEPLWGGRGLKWTEQDFDMLLDELAWAGLGWLSRETIEQYLLARAATWTGQALPPNVPWWRRLW